MLLKSIKKVGWLARRGMGWLAKIVTGRGERVLPATDEKTDYSVIDLLFCIAKIRFLRIISSGLVCHSVFDATDTAGPDVE
jgi:hypothetical protein